VHYVLELRMPSHNVPDFIEFSGAAGDSLPYIARKAHVSSACFAKASWFYGENAAHFDPARYLNADGGIKPGPSDTRDGHVSYGFGRRECPGRHLANNSLFVEFALILWASKIERKKDASGELLPLDMDGYVDNGIVVLVLRHILAS